MRYFGAKQLSYTCRYKNVESVKEPKSGLGWNFNYKLDSFDNVHVLFSVDDGPHLDLKTWPRFCPVSESLSTKNVNPQIRRGVMDRIQIVASLTITILTNLEVSFMLLENIYGAGATHGDRHIFIVHATGGWIPSNCISTDWNSND
jgi:hypothetical protein